MRARFTFTTAATTGDADGAGGAGGAGGAAAGAGGGAAAPLIGRRVRVEGLAARPELNGRCGEARAYDAARGRYTVAVEGEPSPLLLRSDNLAALDHAADHAAAADAKLEPQQESVTPTPTPTPTLPLPLPLTLTLTLTPTLTLTLTPMGGSQPRGAHGND